MGRQRRFYLGNGDSINASVLEQNEFSRGGAAGSWHLSGEHKGYLVVAAVESREEPEHGRGMYATVTVEEGTPDSLANQAIGGVETVLREAFGEAELVGERKPVTQGPDGRPVKGPAMLPKPPKRG